MLRNNILPYSILQYIIDKKLETESGELKLPPMGDLARELRVSRGKLREELIVAQAYGVVDMRPGDGTYILPFDFYSAIRTAVLYSIARDQNHFDSLYRLRVQLEIAFWDKAASKLDKEDHDTLLSILEAAESKLTKKRIEIPYSEHRNLHLCFFNKLENEYVLGLLSSFWDSYEAVGLNIYYDYSYHLDMWTRHRAMVEAIIDGRIDESEAILISHFSLLDDRLKGGLVSS